MGFKLQLIFVFFCVILAFSTLNAKPITYTTQNKVAKQCIEETGIDEDIIHRALKTDWNPPQIYKTYLLCTYKLHGFFDANGIINPDVIARFLADHYTKEDANYILKQCSTIQEINAEETAFETAKCFLEKHKEITRNRKANRQLQSMLKDLREQNLV